MKSNRKMVALITMMVMVINLFTALSVFADAPLTASLTHSAAEKQLTVVFSEAVSTTNFTDTCMLSTNGGISIPLRVVSVSAAEVKFSYKEELKQATEYVVILPQNVKAESGKTLDNRYYWFTTDAGYDSVSVLQSCDYNSGASIYTDIDSYSPSTSGPNYFEDNEHGMVWGVKLKESESDYNLPWGGFKSVSGDITSLSFSMKPLEDLKLDISFLTNDNKTPVNIGFFNGYGIRVGRAWMFGSNTEKLADYTPGTWYDVKLVYDKTANNMYIYINGVMVKALDSTYLADYSGISGVRIMVPVAEADSARTVLLLDNIKSETVEKKTTVSQVRYNYVDGKSVGGLAVADGAVQSIDVKFSDAVKSESITLDTLKVLCDNTEVSYTGALSDDGKTYTITPDDMIVNYNKVKLVSSGILNANNETCAQYNTFVTSNNYSGSVTAEVTSVDEELHRINLELSERISNGYLSKAVLRSSRTGEAQTVTVEKNDGTEVVLTYTNTLDGSAEYALEFAKDTKSIYGGTLTDRWLHFSTSKVNYYNSREAGTWSNYEDNAARVYTNFYGAVDIDKIESENCNRNHNLIDTGDEGYGKAWKVDVVSDASNTTGTWLGNNNLWWKSFAAPTSDLSAVRFSLKPVKWQNTLIEFYDASGKSFGVALRPYYNGLGALRYGKTLYAGSANDGLKNPSTNEVLKYKANEWIDFKVIRNKTLNTMDIYVNEMLAAQLDSTYFDGYTGFADKTEGAGKWFIRIMTQPGQVVGPLGETFLYMDNIYSYSISEASGVTEAKYCGDNDTYHSFENTKEKINSIKVKFSDAIDESSVTGESVKITSDITDAEVSWSKSYDADTKELTLTPETPLPARAKYNLTISGVKLAGSEECISDYVGYVGETCFEVESIGVVDNAGNEIKEFTNDGTYYVGTEITNTTSSEKKVKILVSQYNDGVLADVSIEEVTIPSLSVLSLGNSTESKIGITPKDNANRIKVYVWEDTTVLKPLIEAAVADKVN